MRKLRLAAAVSLALASPGVFALGLGDIEMRSALNQPMNAEIRLTSVKPGELDGMIVKLASADAFARAGIERSQVLQALRFEVDQSGAAPVIRITSNTPVVEPFLNFLLEVDWPQGRMVREYTVLLDPPVFMNPSASGSSALGDSASLGSRDDAALVAPAPIERTDNSAAAVADSFEVELVGSGQETTDATLGGDVVSLDELDADAALLPPSDTAIPEQPPFGDEGEIVSLTDLEQPNTAAEAARAEAAAADFDFDVEVVGTGVEVDDGTVVADGGAAQAASNDVAAAGDEPPAGDEGEIVSLEELDAVPAAGGSTDEGSLSGGDERTVAEGDTLFEIAADAAGDEVSVEQMMLALLAANKAAFIEGNINLVRAGAILRVPEASEARALTQAQAVAEVGKQARLWQEYRDGLRGAGGTRLATADTSTAEPADTDSATDGEDTDSALSADARAILEDARQEILERESLRIVGEGSSSTTTATAGNASDGDDAARLGEIQQRLTLAREELSSTRLEAADLDDQAGELRSTTENFDALIALRENDIAALEARLAEARNAAGNAADGAADAATDTAGDALADAGAAADAAADEASDAVADGAEQVADAASGAAADFGDAASDAADATRNALSDAGQTLESVELVDGDVDGALDAAGDAGAEALADGAEAVGDGVDAAADAAAGVAASGADALTADRPWYQTLFDDPKKLAIAGVGGAALLGALGTLLWRRRKSGDDDAWLADEDEVEFVDGDGVDTFKGGVDGARDSVSGGVKGVAAGAVAGVGAAGAAAAGAFDRDESRVEATDRAVDDAIDDTLAFGAGGSDADADDGLDKDDTISEVDVYLAYGLHGQAEELLGRAIDRDPNNPVYARKLLETYHAQGNGEAFETAAEDFHARFGGDSNPEWPAIAALGNELKPQSPLFAGAAAEVDRVGSDDFGADRFEEGDFSGVADPSAASSISRDFDGASDEVSFDAPTDADLGAPVDETALMDQSLDPAFAFDESDLEATGDFSRIADEVAAESDDGIIDFPALDPSTPADAAPSRTPSEAASAMDAVEFDAGDLDGKAAGALAGGAAAAGAAAAAAGSEASTLADDLTLDLDQLSDELELDSTELLDDPFADLAGSDIGNVETLEMPDLTADNDLLSGSAADIGDADEVDTMMDLAKAYIDMGDKDSASSTLGEIVKSGTPDQVNEAETLLRKIS